MNVLILRKKLFIVNHVDKRLEGLKEVEDIYDNVFTDSCKRRIRTKL